MTVKALNDTLKSAGSIKILQELYGPGDTDSQAARYLEAAKVFMKPSVIKSSNFSPVQAVLKFSETIQITTMALSLPEAFISIVLQLQPLITKKRFVSSARLIIRTFASVCGIWSLFAKRTVQLS